MSEPVQLVEDPEARPASHASVRRHAGTGPFRAATLALAGFAAAAWLLDAALPLYIAPSRTRDAYEHFSAHRDRYDTLFFGSSRTHFQVIPAVFDAAMAEQGRRTHSLNLGVYSMNGLSTEAFLEQILALEPRRLRRVFIDPGELLARVKESQRPLERVVQWHDLDSTWRALRWLRATDPSAGRRRAQTWLHLESFAARQTNAGRAQRWLAQAALGRASFEPDRFDATHRGWDSLDERLRDPDHPKHAIGRRVHDEFVAGIGGYERRLERMRKAAGRRAPLPEHARAYLRRLVRLVEAAGATPVFFVAPRVGTQQAYLSTAREEGEISLLFDYASPDAHPALYEPRHRFDAQHLNDAGSRLLSRSLARDLAQSIAESRES